MIYCDRCGVEVSKSGLCRDCREALEVRSCINSTAEQREQAKVWIEMGIPVREVSDHLRFHRFTIERWAKNGNWERFRWVT